MKKITLLFLIMMSLSTNLMPLTAQDDCEARDIALEVDGLYDDYLRARSYEDLEQAIAALEDFNFALGEALAACGGFSADDPSQAARALGSGTAEDPYGFGQSGASFNSDAAIKVIDMIRPADDIIVDPNVAVPLQTPSGKEWLIVTMEMACDRAARRDCEVDHLKFRLESSAGAQYDAQDINTYEDRLWGRILPSNTRTGGIVFLVDKADTNMRLIFYPEGIMTADAQTPTYYRAQGSVDIAATSRINIRNGPGTSYGIAEALDANERAAATGRNEDGTWIQIESGWVATGLTTASLEDVMILPVIAEEE